MEVEEEDVVIDYSVSHTSGDAMDEEATGEGMAHADGVPSFPALSRSEMNGSKRSRRKLLVPHHRLQPLRKNWMEICDPIVNHMKLDIRMDTKTRHIHLRVRLRTTLSLNRWRLWLSLASLSLSLFLLSLARLVCSSIPLLPPPFCLVCMSFMRNERF